MVIISSGWNKCGEKFYIFVYDHESMKLHDIDTNSKKDARNENERMKKSLENPTSSHFDGKMRSV